MVNETLKDYIKIYDNICDKELCDEIVQLFESQEEHHVYIDRLKRPTFTEMNISQRYAAKDVAWMGFQKQVQSKFVEAVSTYMDEMDIGPDFPAKYAFEEFRVKRYRTNSGD